MTLTSFYLEQLRSEVAINRKILARVPAGRNDWQPHPKSMPLGRLATLVANMPGWIAMMIEQDQLDFAPPGGQTQRPPLAENGEQLLEQLRLAADKAEKALQSTSDNHLATNWRLLAGGHLILEQPRSIFMRDVFPHLAHHRGQLSVYLRLNEALVPAIYGPSADEQ